MAVSGPETSLQTTLQSGWKKVNCGRLFCANDCAYEFFHEIECVVRLRLPQHLKSHHSCKDGLIEAIISSDNIQFLWSMLSADMDGDAIACEPLEEIVKFWVTVRSSSTVSAWVEQYKERAKTNTQKSKALRKTLAQNQQSVTE